MIFGDGVGASLVRSPYCQLDVGLCDLTSNSCGWNLELFEALIANSMLVCVTLMCFYIGTAQLKKVHGWS